MCWYLYSKKAKSFQRHLGPLGSADLILQPSAGYQLTLQTGYGASASCSVAFLRTDCPYPQVQPGWVDLGGWLHTEVLYHTSHYLAGLTYCRYITTTTKPNHHTGSCIWREKICWTHIFITFMLCMSMEQTPHWSPRASSDTVSCTLTCHTWQFVIFTTSLSPLASSLTRSVFHSELKTWLFSKSFPP